MPGSSNYVRQIQEVTKVHTKLKKRRSVYVKRNDDYMIDTLR